MKKLKLFIILFLLVIGTNSYAVDSKIILNPAYCVDAIKTIDSESAKFKYVAATLKKNLHLRVMIPGRPPEWSATAMDSNKTYKALDQDDIPTLIFLLTQNGVSPEIKGLIQETLKLFGQDSIVCINSILQSIPIKNVQVVQGVKLEIIKNLNKK